MKPTQSSQLATIRFFRYLDVSAMSCSDWQMMDIVASSGSESTACPPWFADDLTIDKSQKVQLVEWPRTDCG